MPDLSEVIMVLGYYANTVRWETLQGVPSPSTQPAQQLLDKLKVERREQESLAPSLIGVTSLVSGETHLPWVRFEWQGVSGQVTPAEARAHALLILAAADAADSDAFVVSWATDRVGVEPPVVASLLRDFRAWRDEQRR